jgi:hypothetical protein
MAGFERVANSDPEKVARIVLAVAASRPTGNGRP